MVGSGTFRERFFEQNNRRGELRGIGLIAARANAGFQTGDIDAGADLEELLTTMHVAADGNEEGARQVKAYEILSLMYHHAPMRYSSIAPIGEILADIGKARDEHGYAPQKGILFASVLAEAARNALSSLSMARTYQ